MANHKSAQKRARQNLKRRNRNRHQRSTLRTTLKNYREVLGAKDAAAAESGYPGVQKAIDRAVTKGVLNRHTAARYKSRLAAAMKKMKAA